MLHRPSEYTCPDCGQVCDINDLMYEVGGTTMLVCPNCGVIQESEMLEQLVLAHSGKRA